MFPNLMDFGKLPYASLMNSLKLPNSSHFFHVSSYHFPLASIHVPMLSLIFVNPLLLPYFLRSKSTSTILQSMITNLQYDLYPFLSSQERLYFDVIQYAFYNYRVLFGPPIHDTSHNQYFVLSSSNAFTPLWRPPR